MFIQGTFRYQGLPDIRQWGLILVPKTTQETFMSLQLNVKAYETNICSYYVRVSALHISFIS